MRYLSTYTFVHIDREVVIPANEAMGEPMDVLTDKHSLGAEEPAVKELLPNSLVGNSGAAATSGEDTMQVDEEITSSAGTLSECDKLTV